MKAKDYQTYLKKEFNLGENRIISAAGKPSSNIAQQSGGETMEKAM